jgi:4'-phosphopantetheinyl transferase
VNADILVVRGRISTLARAPWLSSNEHRHAATLGRARAAFIAGRTLVRRVLGDPELEIIEVPDGKPHLAREGIDFNVSHSGELVLVAVARGRRVGVDVEQISHHRDTTALAEALGPDAAFELHHTPIERRPARFSCWWVRIEALCKATGAGLTFPVDTAIPPGFAVRDIPMHAGYRAAVAFDGDPHPRLAIHDWSTP